jgi:MFS family permease
VISARAGLSRPTSFWLLAGLLGLFLFSASAPSPLYAVYAAQWQFAPSTLTVIYAVYAFGALAALLTTGRLSDHVGRRPVVIVALVVQIAGMAAFIAARGVGELYLGRILQGVGTGMATGSISAWLLDLQPPDSPRLGALVAGIAPMAGLAAGALGSGLLVQYGPDPQHLVFWLLMAVYAAALAVLLAVPDPVQRRPGWLASMRPQIGVPPSARSLFAASAPSLIATWAVGGLYLSLGPSLAGLLLQSDNRLSGGLVIVTLLGAGALASALVGATHPGVLMIRGSLVLIAGVGITLGAVALNSVAGLFIGSAVAGLGLGPAFSGVVRGLAPLAPPGQRGALLAAVYVVLYLSFSVPAIIAGVAATEFGLRAATYAFGVAVVALAATTTVAVSRQRVGTASGG